MNQEIKNRTKWFTHDRFGMFIHWGLYAIPARGEWVMSHEEIPLDEYKKYFDRDIYLTMNGTDFILAEFNFFKPVDIVDAVFELSHRGYKVIVAHFERYPYAAMKNGT